MLAIDVEWTKYRWGKLDDSFDSQTLLIFKLKGALVLLISASRCGLSWPFVFLEFNFGMVQVAYGIAFKASYDAELMGWHSCNWLACIRLSCCPSVLLTSEVVE